MPEPGIEVGRRALGIAAELLRADAGERAAARRMDAGGAPLFWRVVARYRIAPHEEEKWRRITKMLALLTPASATESLHVDGRPFGAVLADGGDARAHLTQPAFSEQRLARLLAARGAARLEALERAVRALARNHPKLDVPSLAWAVLNEDGRAIARAYYARLDRRQDTPQDSPVEEQSDV
jgi:CRISPR type I-E-associated protein CasB/Cse2